MANTESVSLEYGYFEMKFMPVFREMLKNLQSKGYFLALASSKPQIYVERILEHFDLKKYLAVVVGSELTAPERRRIRWCRRPCISCSRRIP